MQGVAEKIPFEEGSYDAVVNVESARCYRDIEVFFRGVHKVLDADGHFLFADMIEKEEVKDIREKLHKCGFKIVTETEITKNVAKGLVKDTIRRKELIHKKVPGMLRKSFESFAGTEGTKRFESFTNGKFEYWSFVLAKN